MPRPSLVKKNIFRRNSNFSNQLDEGEAEKYGNSKART